MQKEGEARLRELALKLFSLSRSRVRSSRCTEMLMYQSLFGTTTSLWMR